MYMMPLEHLTWEFIRKFLTGEKRLLHRSAVCALQNVPKLTLLPCQDLWELIRNDPELSMYFDTSTNKYPSKQYMLDVTSCN